MSRELQPRRPGPGHPDLPYAPGWGCKNEDLTAVCSTYLAVKCHASSKFSQIPQHQRSWPSRRWFKVSKYPNPSLTTALIWTNVSSHLLVKLSTSSLKPPHSPRLSYWAPDASMRQCGYVHEDMSRGAYNWEVDLGDEGESFRGRYTRWH